MKRLRGGLCFFKRHMGWWGYRNEPVVRPADFGWPDHRPAVSAEFSAKILGGGLGRPDRRRVFRPRTAVKPHRGFIPMSSSPSPNLNPNPNQD